ncbi:MAG: hypothetical protein NTZ15_09625, partial [Burkholderiales bacterium]|nr:hypothetical protein [Burkholderiales bacterium]
MLEFLLVILLVYVAYKIYVNLYFKGEQFAAIKGSISLHTKNCNDLNEHIENLKSSYSDVGSFEYGKSQLSDDSLYNMKRRRWNEEEKSNRTHNCSSTVCKNASGQPFKYLCKYFNIKTNEETLSTFEEVLNN